MAWRSAPELAPYQDEPAQLPSGSLGKNAFLRLGFERRGGRTALVTLHRRAPLLAQQALYYDDAMPDLPCVQIITTSGDILQGNRQAIEIDLAEGTQAHVTTQAATKIHEMDANFAAQTQEITLRPGAYLEYLPHPIIPYRHARFMTHTRIVIDPSATLLYSEILMPGRKYYGDGELFLYDLFSSTVLAQRPDTAELFTEKFVVEPKTRGLRLPGCMGSFDVFGNVLVLAPKASAGRIIDFIEPSIDLDAGLAVGASVLPSEAWLVVKILGMHANDVRAKVRDVWSLVRREVTGASIPDRFLWD